MLGPPDRQGASATTRTPGKRTLSDALPTTSGVDIASADEQSGEQEHEVAAVHSADVTRRAALAALRSARVSGQGSASIEARYRQAVDEPGGRRMASPTVVPQPSQIQGSFGEIYDAEGKRGSSPRPAALRGPTRVPVSVSVAPATQVGSHWGDFIAAGYRQLPNGDGVEIDLRFRPGDGVEATKIGFVQSVINTKRGAPAVLDPTEKLRIVPGGHRTGHKIDRRVDRTNPIYGADNTATGKLEDTRSSNAPAGSTPDPGNATYQLGHRCSETGEVTSADAWMHDAPESDRSPNSGMEFETTALALDGPQKGTYYGSVRWGYQVDGTGTLTKIAFALISQGAPSQRFLAAASAWNAATARGTVVVSADHAQLYDLSMTPILALARGTAVNVTNAGVAAGVNYSKVTIHGGPHAGKTGYIKVTELVDRGDGKATADLPVPDVHVLREAAALRQPTVRRQAEERNLAPGTRVLKLADRPVPPEAAQVWISVIDGPETAAEGCVDVGKLVRERP